MLTVGCGHCRKKKEPPRYPSLNCHHATEPALAAASYLPKQTKEFQLFSSMNLLRERCPFLILLLLKRLLLTRLLHWLPSWTLCILAFPGDFIVPVGPLPFLATPLSWTIPHVPVTSTFCTRLEPLDKGKEGFTLCLFVWLSILSLPIQLRMSQTMVLLHYVLFFAQIKLLPPSVLLSCVPTAWSHSQLASSPGELCLKTPSFDIFCSFFALSPPYVNLSCSLSAKCNFHFSYYFCISWHYSNYTDMYKKLDTAL